jgi:N-methylhydantoinase B
MNTRTEAATAAPSSRRKVSPITQEVVTHSLIAYADEMALALCKSAYNMMIYEVRDFCCGLIDTDGLMICQNTGGLPIFLADLGIAVKDGIERYGLDGFAPGDVVIMNHGGVCGQHLNNVVVYTPCFHKGKVVAFAANRAHWVDVGGMRTGFGNLQTYEIYHEGLQMRSIKLYEAGRRNEGVWQMITDNIRFPESSLGDLRAQTAACHIGSRRLSELLSRFALETVVDCIHASWDQAEQEARAAVARIPDGRYSAETWLDNDGRNPDVPLRVKVTVEVAGSDLTIDYSEMHPQVQSPLNSGWSGGLSAARVWASGASPCPPSSTRSCARCHRPCPASCLRRTRATWGASPFTARARTPARATCSSTSTAAAGAGARTVTGSPARSRSARATCATRRWSCRRSTTPS